MALVGIAENPVPEGAVDGVFQTRDGVGLRFARWRASAHRCRGTVCLVHGRSESIEKYFETVVDLRRRGFAVATFDWRGQGGSQRLFRRSDRGHVETFDQYAGDLSQFMAEIVLAECPPPYFGLGHSMGATAMLLASRRRPAWFERLVLSAPMLGITLGGVPHSVMRTVSEIMGLVALGERPITIVPRKAREGERYVGNVLTSDRRRFERTAKVLAAAPHLRTGQPTFAWLHAACCAIDMVLDEAFPTSVQTPFLMVAAGADRVVSTPAIEHYARRFRAGAQVVVPGARHELLMEADIFREQFWAAFDAFVPGSVPLHAETLEGA